MTSLPGMARWVAGALALSLAAPVALAPAAAAAVEVAPHRALYLMKLAKAREASGVASVDGAILYEWGDSCEGWTIEQRYRLIVNYNEGAQSEVDVRYSAWEAKDGGAYRFFVRKLRDGTLGEELAGSAKIGPDGRGEAVFTQPAEQKMTLARGTLFPAAHTVAVVAAAQKGARFFPARIFDGSELQPAMDVYAVIGEGVTPESGAPAMLMRPAWPIRMAFFDADASGSEPEYELKATIQDDGIIRSMVIDYGTFVVDVRLERIEGLPRPRC